MSESLSTPPEGAAAATEPAAHEAAEAPTAATPAAEPATAAGKDASAAEGSAEPPHAGAETPAAEAAPKQETPTTVDATAPAQEPPSAGAEAALAKETPTTVDATAPAQEPPSAGAEAALAKETPTTVDATAPAQEPPSAGAEATPAKETPTAGAEAVPVQEPPSTEAAAAPAQETPAPEADAVPVQELPATEAAAAPAKEPPSAKRKKKAATARPAKAKAPPVPDPPEIAVLRKAKNQRREVEGKVIGWNSGGFHVVVDTVTAFCPRSEMEPGEVQDPQVYVDQTFPFLVLRIQKKAKRVVVSRVAALRAERARRRTELREQIVPGAVMDGRVASLTDFGAFVDLGGVQGLVHVSEIRRERLDKPAEALAVGQEVRVKVLKVEQGGKRISLSMKALEPDPWKGIKERFSEGAVVDGVVEKVASFGAFVALEPGLTGLLPTSGMTLPRGSSAARIFPPGKRVSVQILRVDPRRRRISLALEGSKLEGSRADFESYLKGQKRSSGGFNALAAALEKIRQPRE